jgi:hypothetical protein
MKTKLELGSRVVISKQGLDEHNPSRMHDCCNPPNVTGTIVETDRSGLFIYEVEFDNGDKNQYREGDLQLVESTKNTDPSVDGKFTVDGKFIKEAYETACPEWKTKIKEKFPEVFEKASLLKAALEEFGKDSILHGYKVLTYSYQGREYMFVPLPNANREWTFSAFDFVKEFTQKFPECYPVHGNSKLFESFFKSEEFAYASISTVYTDKLDKYIVIRCFTTTH